MRVMDVRELSGPFAALDAYTQSKHDFVDQFLVELASGSGRKQKIFCIDREARVWTMRSPPP
jgi:hypothetical protein